MIDQNRFLTSLKTVPKKSVVVHNLDPTKFNEYFAKFADEIEMCLESPMEHFDRETNEKILFMLPTDQAEIFKFLNKCSKSIIVGYDFKSNQLLSLSAPVLAQPVTYLRNRWLSEGVFPSIFKLPKFYHFTSQVMLLQSKTIDLYQ